MPRKIAVKRPNQKRATDISYIRTGQGFLFLSVIRVLYGNALAENFYSIHKTECIYRTKPATLADAKELIGVYIYFYNNQRIQTKTKLTPLELRRQYVA